MNHSFIVDLSDNKYNIQKQARQMCVALAQNHKKLITGKSLKSSLIKVVRLCPLSSDVAVTQQILFILLCCTTCWITH